MADKVICLCVIGTRPEVIKMAPVIERLAASDWARPLVVSIGQHVELLDRAVADFGLSIDHRVTIDRRRGSILEVASQAMDQLDEFLDGAGAGCVVAQGDTTTVMAAAMVAFYRRLPFVHVEAGLRTGDLSAPFPEEFNRRVAAIGASLHCAPTEQAAQALRAEGVAEAAIVQSGNTVIDALLAMKARKPALPGDFPAVPRPILVTAHRRESFGPQIEEAFGALREAVDRYADIGLYFPVHPNPNIRAVAQRILGGHERIVLTEPLAYAQLVAALGACWAVVTDSGGLQEEAPALGKPVLVLRDVTERPEAIASGAVRLVGTDRARILDALDLLHESADAYAQMARPVFPYGDGHAANRIVEAMRRSFGPVSPVAGIQE
ncbi:MAG: UDP-N-acetylglucosamine 2-epimerase (non-hydrolyzing) [Devosia sp.]|uniref:non-hydrolyzing UDP-N-acetylglucosamine 2-epimerase n=1 Tax=Devosia sp. TaxID=1871048 RepID=UPI0024C96BF0|nr:UDP-N-acetylglucosamine 2-epimerase (non-hydrolyzing) [Devosia sp.]UYO00560.1 MAG: UDP-N-acetylglucosamine 2-epimerase (non-hydrolyzing) [Devosia sp.]